MGQHWNPLALSWGPTNSKQLKLEATWKVAPQFSPACSGQTPCWAPALGGWSAPYPQVDYFLWCGPCQPIAVSVGQGQFIAEFLGQTTDTHNDPQGTVCVGSILNQKAPTTIIIFYLPANPKPFKFNENLRKKTFLKKILEPWKDGTHSRKPCPPANLTPWGAK